MSSNSALERKLARETASRKAAEQLLEQKSLELFEANQQLTLALSQLKKQNRDGLQKLEFEQQISEGLIHFGRAFLSRNLDDGLVSSLLERLKHSSALSHTELFLLPKLVPTLVADRFNVTEVREIGQVKPYAVWEANQLRLPLEVDYKTIGELSVVLNDVDVDRDFVVSQITLVADLLCSAISRQLIITSNQKARARAEESEKATKEFVAMINHELRTPLNGLLGSAELLAETQLNDEQSTLLNNLVYSGDLLRLIINDILDFSKISAGMMELIPSRFEWASVKQMLNGIFQSKAIEKGVDFRIKESTPIPPILIGDFERICQVMVNLVGNAVKFTRQGSVSVTTQWKHDQLTITVEDTGIGIEQEDLSTLFDPFVQVDRTATRHFEGTGLGLAICKNLVELMRGHIHVHSVKGGGSTFTVTIPLVVGEEEIDTEHARPDGNDAVTLLEQISILVVDDIRMNQVIINQMLKKLSIQPDIATNGIEAIKAASDHQYDLIFMDCRMPEMDGFEATRYLREQNYTLPIIALTAGTTLEEREKCIVSGMNDILTKPYTAQDLRLMLEKWV
ncbi:ATP-binding protein [Vibrio sinaloensis]|uniref:histidine kinase n=1 Tax=Photobacterium sp. (strain ATCC 43367) TaxID=379097 RepID=A0A0A5HTT7_PHOS4|nr:ATP-binding protein [Vibrio sinaloensis]KGY07745.1 histidine kinase [Vibrio sinaloensis]